MQVLYIFSASLSTLYLWIQHLAHHTDPPLTHALSLRTRVYFPSSSQHRELFAWVGTVQIIKALLPPTPSPPALPSPFLPWSYLAWNWTLHMYEAYICEFLWPTQQHRREWFFLLVTRSLLLKNSHRPAASKMEDLRPHPRCPCPAWLWQSLLKSQRRWVEQLVLKVNRHCGGDAAKAKSSLSSVCSRENKNKNKIRVMLGLGR